MKQFKSRQIIHTDFKRAPPKLDCLINVIQLHKDFGFAGCF